MTMDPKEIKRLASVFDGLPVDASGMPLSGRPPRSPRMIALSMSPSDPVEPGVETRVQHTVTAAFRPQRIVCNVRGLGRTIEKFGTPSRKRRKGRRRSHLFFALLLRNPTPYLTINNIVVGVNSQFARDIAVPADLFSPEYGSFGTPELNLDVAHRGGHIQIWFGNLDCQSIVVGCTMLGIEAF